MFSRRNLIFLLIIFLSLFLSLVVVVKRIVLELNNNNVEVAIDYSGFERICRSEGSDIYSGFQILLKGGVNSAVIREETVATLAEAGYLSVFSGNDLLRSFRSSGIINPILVRFIQKRSIQPNFTYILVSDQKLHDRVYNELKIKLKDDEQKLTVASENLAAGGENDREPLFMISVSSTSPDVQRIGVGFSPEALSLLHKLNFSVIVALADSSFLTPGQMDRLMEKIQMINNLSGFMIEGGVAPGYSEGDPRNADHFGRKLAERYRARAKFVMIENEGFIGSELVTRYLREMAVRGYRPVAPGRRPPATLTEHNATIDAVASAVRERNVRLIITDGIPAKLRGVPINLLMQNFNFLDTMVRRVKADGFNIKSASSFETDLASPIMVVIISWGVLAIYIMLFEYYFVMPRKLSYLILIVFMAFMLIFSIKWYGTVAMTYYRFVISVFAAFVFPLAPIVYRIRPERLLPKNSDFYIVFYRSVFLLLYTMFFVFLFGTQIVGILSSVEFINGLESFRGIGLTVAASVLAALLIALRSSELPGKARNFLDASIKVHHLVIFFFAAALFYNLPSWFAGINAAFPGYDGLASFPGAVVKGIAGTEVSALEYAFGYPVLLLYFYLNLRNVRRFNVPLAACGVLGSVSFINSMCQVGTPLLVTAVRSFYGLLCGVMIGAALCSLAEFLIDYFHEGEVTAER